MMDARDILKATETARRLIQDDDYYKYIFKKTERIVSVVFYVLNSVPETHKTETHVEDIQHAARAAHDAVLQSLETRAHVAEDVVRGVAHALITLESKLSVAQVAGVIAPSVHNVFVQEIDAVLRGLNKYTGEETPSLVFTESESSQKQVQTPVRKHVATSTHTVATTAPQSSVAPGRRERIKTILEAKGEATIKDISEIVTDVSEKTIQRELQAMIEDNIVKRQGERRWSKYSLF